MHHDDWSAPSPPRELFVLDARGGAPRRIAGGSTRIASAVWLPDGGRIAFTELVGREWETWMLDVESGERNRLGSGSIRAIDPEGSTALLETASALHVVDVVSGSIGASDAYLSGWDQESGRGRAHALVDARLAIHDGLPARGAKQRLGWGMMWPGASYPLRLTEWESGRSTVLVPQTWSSPFAYSPFEFPAGDS
jgi:hypothetical protein